VKNIDFCENLISNLFCFHFLKFLLLMKVLKFGGSSVASSENIKKVIEIVKDYSLQNDLLVIVVSALGGITDQLIMLARIAKSGDQNYQDLLQQLFLKHDQVIQDLIADQYRLQVSGIINKKYQELTDILTGVYLLRELSNSSLDVIMSFGEQFSSLIVAYGFKSIGLDCGFVDSRKIIKTDDNFGSANVNLEKTYSLCKQVFNSEHKIYVCGGFIGSNDKEMTTTLGRGGSDYTAALIGGALDAEIIEIWTDVDGVLTADPRKVPSAFSLTEVSYEEAGELAHFGAKVIHPKTMQPARLKKIPIVIKNTFNPKAAGTIICDNPKRDNKYQITGVTTLSDVNLVEIYSNNGKSVAEIAHKTTDSLSKAGIEILLITQGSYEPCLSIAVSAKDALLAKSVIEKNFSLEIKSGEMLPVKLQEERAIVSIIGNQMKGSIGLSGKFFKTLGDQNINIYAIAQGSTELNISAVIHEKHKVKALQAVHQAFFENKTENIHLFVVGTGLIGSAVLHMITQFPNNIKLCGVANSRKFVVWEKPADPTVWKQALDSSEDGDLEEFVHKIIELNLPNSVFVDCTASAEVPLVYSKLLQSHIAVITSNKKANSGSYDFYREIKEVSANTKINYLYETTVGAGLPIIQTIQNLVKSGDRIIKIEAILSGTLSYIFNTFATTNDTFSKIVRGAKDKGYTEPDPRDDLNGMDMARKILILARESGLKIEMSDVILEPFLPPSCFVVDSVDAFFDQLSKLDEDFAEKKRLAKSEGKLFRYIAKMENGKVSLSLQLIDQNHPFYNLSGTDNIVSITTQRYNFNPLVIKGPGAGAEVTAGGIIADILNAHPPKY